MLRALLSVVLAAALLGPACATYEETAMTSALDAVDSILEMPGLHSTLIQDGFRSGFFLNESGVEVRLRRPRQVHVGEESRFMKKRFCETRPSLFAGHPTPPPQY